MAGTLVGLNSNTAVPALSALASDSGASAADWRDTSTYDYIVVGAESAGAVVAGRLSEVPATRVLLVGAGGAGRHLNIQIPAAFSKQFRTKHDWEFQTEPEPYSSTGPTGRSTSRTCAHPTP